MRFKEAKKLKSHFDILAKSVWLFPIICAVIVVSLTALRISGSSVGSYDQLFGQSLSSDKNLVFGHPRSIRSDEWEFNTPMIISQSRNHFNRINPDIGNGQDMSVVVDVPYKDWSAVFRPQNLVFFVLPLEYAFAFKWWLLAYLLVIGCYFFTLHFLPRQRMLASLLSISLLFSPFIQWWYQTITIAPIFLSFFIALTSMRLIDGRDSKRVKIALSALLAYLLTWFGLILYPPFQIPCAIVTAVLVLSYLWAKYTKNKKSSEFKSLYYLASGCIAAALLLIAFIETRRGVIATVENTAYPGHRLQGSGGFDVRQFFSSHLSIGLQWTGHALNYVANQSEASNFILIGPFLLIPSAYILFRQYTRKQKLDWPLLAINALVILFLLRIFLPFFSPLYRLILLDRVPHARLLIGFGLLGIVQIILLTRQVAKITIPRIVVWGTTILAFVVSALAALDSGHLYPGFIRNPVKLLLLSLILAVIVYLIQMKKTVLLGVALLAGFCFVSSAGVNPLYRGLGPLTSTNLAQTIRQIGDKQGKWIVTDNLSYENYPIENGLRSLSGTYAYPQMQLWQSLDQKPSDQKIYNRYAHVLFVLDSSIPQAQLVLKQPDFFEVEINPCANFLKQEGVHYVLTSVTLTNTNSCLGLIKTVHSPSTNFNIYEVKSTT